jgi:peptidoglycan hydrolase CwlO-like protein
MKKRWITAMGLILVGVGVWAAGGPTTTQSPTSSPPQRPRQEPEAENNPALPNAEKKALEENDKDMKKKVDRLFELATELKAEVDKTDSSRVLSLNLVKKAEEIEKLARDIKNKGKG